MIYKGKPFAPPSCLALEHPPNSPADLSSSPFFVAIFSMGDKIEIYGVFGKIDIDTVITGFLNVTRKSNVFQKLCKLSNTDPKQKNIAIYLKSSGNTAIKKIQRKLCDRVKKCQGNKELYCSALSAKVLEEAIMSV